MHVGIACFNVYRQKFPTYDYHNGYPGGFYRRLGNYLAGRNYIA